MSNRSSSTISTRSVFRSIRNLPFGGLGDLRRRQYSKLTRSHSSLVPLGSQTNGFETTKIFRRLYGATTPTLPSGFRVQLERADSDKDIDRVVELCQDFKRAAIPPSPDDIKLAYRHLISVLAHYRLWTQLYATVNELMELVELDQIDDLLWSSILEAFIRCGKSTDVIYSYILSTLQNLGPLSLGSLLRGAIIETNLSQSILLLQVAISSNLLRKIQKPILVQFVSFLAEQGQLNLAIDLTHSYIVPITDDDPPSCVENLMSLLRHCVYQSDPKSTLYCYSYLSNHHPEIMTDFLDDGFMIELLSLSSRHIMPDVTLKVLSQLVKSQSKLEITHLFPSIISLCRGGNRMAEVIEILLRIRKDVILAPEDNELIGFNLMIGHLGGLQVYRDLLRNGGGEPHRALSTLEEDPIKAKESIIASLDRSKTLCQQKLLEYSNQANEDARRPSGLNPTILQSLIHSLIQADLEIGRPHESLASFKLFFNHHHPPSRNSSFSSSNSTFYSRLVEPDRRTISLIQTAIDRTSDPILEREILSLIEDQHRFNRLDRNQMIQFEL